MDVAAEKCRKLLATAYRERFAGLIVYGSVARNDATTDSDLDLLVLLKGSFEYFSELRAIADLLYPIQLEVPLDKIKMLRNRLVNNNFLCALIPEVSR